MEAEFGKDSSKKALPTESSDTSAISETQSNDSSFAPSDSVQFLHDAPVKKMSQEGNEKENVAAKSHNGLTDLPIESAAPREELPEPGKPSEMVPKASTKLQSNEMAIKEKTVPSVIEKPTTFDKPNLNESMVTIDKKGDPAPNVSNSLTPATESMPKTFAPPPLSSPMKKTFTSSLYGKYSLPKKPLNRPNNPLPSPPAPPSPAVLAKTPQTEKKNEQYTNAVATMMPISMATMSNDSHLESTNREATIVSSPMQEEPVIQKVTSKHDADTFIKPSFKQDKEKMQEATTVVSPIVQSKKASVPMSSTMKREVTLEQSKKLSQFLALLENTTLLDSDAVTLQQGDDVYPTSIKSDDANETLTSDDVKEPFTSGDVERSYNYQPPTDTEIKTFMEASGISKHASDIHHLKQERNTTPSVSTQFETPNNFNASHHQTGYANSTETVNVTRQESAPVSNDSFTPSNEPLHIQQEFIPSYVQHGLPSNFSSMFSHSLQEMNQDEDIIDESIDELYDTLLDDSNDNHSETYEEPKVITYVAPSNMTIPKPILKTFSVFDGAYDDLGASTSSGFNNLYKEYQTEQLALKPENYENQFKPLLERRLQNFLDNDPQMLGYLERMTKLGDLMTSLSFIKDSLEDANNSIVQVMGRDENIQSSISRLNTETHQNEPLNQNKPHHQLTKMILTEKNVLPSHLHLQDIVYRIKTQLDSLLNESEAHENMAHNAFMDEILTSMKHKHDLFNNFEVCCIKFRQYCYMNEHVASIEDEAIQLFQLELLKKMIECDSPLLTHVLRNVERACKGFNIEMPLLINNLVENLSLE